MTRTETMMTQLERIRLRLSLVSNCREESGQAGEELTKKILNEAGIPWISLEQNKSDMSENLLSTGAKRPDFLLFLGGTAFFLDSKVRGAYAVDGIPHLAIEKGDFDKLCKTQTLSGIDVFIGFIKKDEAAKQTVSIYICPISSLTVCFDYKGNLYNGVRLDSLSTVGATLDLPPA
jgi:hypothetical protein